MNIDIAKKHFETVLQIAERSNDSTMEHLALGLIALTDALKTDSVANKKQLTQLMSKTFNTL